MIRPAPSRPHRPGRRPRPQRSDADLLAAARIADTRYRATHDGRPITRDALRGWQALICILFGFYLASTGVAPYIRHACRAVARFIAGIDA